jgi:aminoglycoside phosphotransferase (APT) family kinase protein
MSGDSSEQRGQAGETSDTVLPPEVVALLVRSGLAEPGAELRATALRGGVSSDIWRVQLAREAVCVKRALPRLKVVADWRAPVDRNTYEVAWLEIARSISPEAVPRVLAHDRVVGCFAMEYLDPAIYRVWKHALRQGEVDDPSVVEVGRRLVRIHAATAGHSVIARRFATDAIFHAIRLEPYLAATAARHPDLAPILLDLLDATLHTKRALVHGDVSPKNILLGPAGPVFLDAECAWYGDPAFDLAFCLNHLLLKCLWTPRASARFLDAFALLAATYLSGVSWETPDEVEARTARLLPGLFLARVDGKSPVEYIVDEGQRRRVRRVARALLQYPAARLERIRTAWAAELALETPPASGPR